MGIFKPEVECASRDEMKALQTERLKKMVKNAYENVPFYKQKLDEAGVSPDDIKSIDDIAKLPFTVKEGDIIRSAID
jgi:phenylacetate-CoA ligase